MAQRRGFLAQLFGNGQNTRSQPAISSNQRRINRATQTALNYFEFDAGAVDGIFGRKSRAAARAYQSFLGYEATGHLTPDEGRFLLDSFNEIANKNEDLAQTIALGLATPQALLKALAEGNLEAVSPPENIAPLPPLSMRATCVNIGASGTIDLLKAQFCNLRQLAVEQSNFLMDTALNGQTRAPVVEECRLFSVEMQPQIAQIQAANGPELIAEMDLWIRRSGVSGEKLARLSETCLGLAYQHDDSEAALASLLVLSGQKNAVYTELLGYHLTLGLGFTHPSFSTGRSWMEAALATQTEGPVALTAQTSQARRAVLDDVIRLLSVPE